MRLAGVVILAGGNSKRMGTPKAKLKLPGGETLLNYHVRHATPLNVPIMIADNEHGFKVDEALAARSEAPIFHIKDYGQNDKKADNSKTDDKYKNTGGALAAIESALQTSISFVKDTSSKNSLTDYLLVISCDSLIKATELWQHLSAATNRSLHARAVVCLSDDSHLYPLLGVYQLAIEPELRAYLDNGQRRVMRFIEPICQKVAFDPQWQYLTNFNTPEDFVKACQALS